jgi:hypothetical protein
MPAVMRQLGFSLFRFSRPLAMRSLGTYTRFPGRKKLRASVALSGGTSNLRLGAVCFYSVSCLAFRPEICTRDIHWGVASRSSRELRVQSVGLDGLAVFKSSGPSFFAFSDAAGLSTCTSTVFHHLDRHSA